MTFDKNKSRTAFAPARFRSSRNQGPPVKVLVGVIFLSLFLSGFCGIISELALFNLAESLLGGTNANLTYTMGLMMFAMGVGSAFTAHRLFRNVSIDLFIAVECALSVVTMGSVVGIYYLAGWLPGSAAVAIWTVSPLVGLLVGLEIPIVLRINEALGLRLRLNASLVMAPDYFGSLVAFVGFTFWLLPELGLARVAWLGGLLNLAVAGAVALVYIPYLKRPLLVVAFFVVLAPLAVGLGVKMPELMARAEQLHYRDGIIQARVTPYQRIVITDRDKSGNPQYRNPAPSTRLIAREGNFTLRERKGAKSALCRKDIRLFINGGLQFSTCDEHRYHEMLVHPALSLIDQPRRALVLGGGDGMAIRELLKYPQLEIKVVELDGVMVELFRDDPRFSYLNGGSLADPRVIITVDDAFRFLRETEERFDLVLMDFPDPHHTVTARLYSRQFFHFAGRVLSPGGVLATQSMSPIFQRRAFLSVRKTMESAGFHVISLSVPMLTFEHWGFQVGSLELPEEALRDKLENFEPTVPTRFLNRESVQAAHRWDKEIWLDYDTVPVNDLFTLPLTGLYREGQGQP